MRIRLIFAESPVAARKTSFEPYRKTGAGSSVEIQPIIGANTSILNHTTRLYGRGKEGVAIGGMGVGWGATGRWLVYRYLRLSSNIPTGLGAEVRHIGQFIRSVLP
jgi:hypothetical protein